MIITIDGPSAAGKSTVAKEVAKKLGFNYIDSGALYRVIAYVKQMENVADENLSDFLKTIDFESDSDQFFYKSANITAEIRTGAISLLASHISTFSQVRAKVNELVKKAAASQSSIVDGRDMGSRVFPNANLKVFLQGSSEVRAKRRFTEAKEKDPSLSYETCLADTIARDLQDSTRDISPMKPADDAIIICVDDLSIDEITNFIVEKFLKSN